MHSLSTRRSRLAVASFWFTVLTPALLFAYAGYARRWAGDDGFINLRVVSQLLGGEGFVYNAGERVEAVTSPAWVGVLWLLGELGANLETAAWIAALVFSVIGLAAATWAASASSESEPVLTLPLGALAYASIPVAWEYGTSALENGLGLAFLGIASLLMTRVWSQESRRRWPVALFVGMAPLVRPDFTVFALPLLVLLVSLPRTTKARVAVAALAALPGGCFQIFRMGYFAGLVPNTALAKSAFEARWDQGLHYFMNTFGTYYLAVPLSIIALVLIARLRERVHLAQWRSALLPASVALGGALHTLYVVRVGGDFMHGRMLLPGLFAIFTSVGSVRARFEARQGALAALAFVAMLAWGVACARGLRPEYYVDGILDERRWWTDNAGEANPTSADQYAKHKFYSMSMEVKTQIAAGCPAGLASLDANSRDRCQRVAWLLDDSPGGGLVDHASHELLALEPGAAAPHVVGVYAFRPLGVAGRMMGLRINIVDAYGLADPIASRSELPTRGRPGHEKELPTVWFAAKYAAAGSTSDARVAMARRALSCGLLRELRSATRSTLTLERFVANIPLAFKLHRLRIPADPELAIRQFCPGVGPEGVAR
jgi:arabinofuranosyltransferase